MFKTIFSRVSLIFFLQWFLVSGVWALDCNILEFKITNSSLKYCIGQEAILTTEVKNTDGGTITYKWFGPGISNQISGETSSSLKISNIDKSKAGKYKCEVTVIKDAVTCVKSVEIDVSVVDQFSFDLGADMVVCNDGAGINLNPNVANSSSVVSYSWSSIPSGILGTSKQINVTTNQVAPQTNLTLTATAGNCIYKDEIKITSNVMPPTPSFDYTKDRCLNEIIEFTNTTIGSGLTYKWTFTGGITSTLINPTFTFPAVFGNGTTNYNVKLESIYPNGCISSITTPISIKQLPDPLIKNFDVKPFINCGASNYNLKVSDKSTTKTSNVYFEIDWGDETPKYSGNTFPSPPEHLYTKKGYSYLLYKITGSNGCKNEFKQTVFNGTNPAVGLGNPGGTVNLCVARELVFPITSTSGNPPGTNYLFETNTAKSSVTFNHPPPNTYAHIFDSSSCGAIGATIQNSFYVRIKAENPCGFSYSTIEPITTSIKPKADFTQTPDKKTCVNTVVKFTNLSKDGVTVDNYGTCDKTTINNWIITPSTGWEVQSGSNLGDPDPTLDPDTWGSKNLYVKFTKGGNYNISMIVRNSCGNDTITKPYCIQSPPTPSFTATPKNGCSPLVSTLTNTSLNINQCDSVVRKWIVTKTKSTCVNDSAVEFRFISGSTDASMHPIIRFNNEGEYQVVLQLSNMCGVFTSSPEIFVVKRKPIVNVTVPANICFGTSLKPTSIVQDCGGVISSYKWTFTGGVPSTQNTLVAPSVSYSISGIKNVTFEAANLCGTSSVTKNIEVLTPPIVDAGLDKSMCSGETKSIGISPNTDLTYTWSPSTGLSSVNSLITDLSLSNSSNAFFEVKYVVTAKDNNNCLNKDSVYIKVYPKPTLNITPTATEICKNTSTTLAASGTTTNTATPTWTYSWSPNTSLSSTVGASVVANPSSTITYTVTGSDGICSNSKLITITVKELPVIENTPASQNVCSGSKTSIVNWTSSLSSTYRWELKSNSGNVTGTIASGIASLSEMTLVNPTFVDQTVVYSVIPTSNLCDGPVFEYSIIVKPKPKLTISPFTKTTYCGGEQITVPSFSSSVSGADYQWSLSIPKPLPSTITGIPNNHAGNGQMSNLTINNNSSSPVSFTYSIKPIANGCEGDPKEFSFTIFPAPSIQDPFTSSQEVCSESNTAVVPFSSATSNVKYVWTIQSIPTGLNSPSKLADSVTNTSSFSIPSFNFKNSTPNPLEVNIVVKAATSGAAACPGQTKTHKISVNPNPDISLSTQNQLVCHNQSSTPINFSSTTNSNMSYTWTNSNTSIGLAASGAGLTIASFAAQNNSKSIVNATVSVTPVYKTINSTCNGVSKDVVIKVLPLPEVLPIVSQVKCSGELTDLVTPSMNPATGSTYEWTLTGDLPNASSLSSGTGNIVSTTAENNGSTIKTAVYKITPSFISEGKSCVGSDLSFTIKVLPKPVLNPISNQEKCSQTTNDLVNFTTSPNTGVDIQWQNDLAIGIPTSGIGNIASLTVTNATSSPITSTFTAIPSFTNAGKTCSGDIKSFTIKVNPIPKVNPIADVSICPQFVQSEIPFSSDVTGATFTWANIGANVGLSTPTGTGNIASFTSVNTTDLVQTALIKVTPTANACVGSSLDFKINIKPKPRIALTPLNQEVCSGDKNQEVVWISSVNSPSLTYSWTSSPLTSGLTINPSSGTGNIPPTYDFINTGTTPISVKFIVKSTVDLCESDPTDYTLTINPRPSLENIDSKIVCSGVPFTSSTFTSTIASSTYDWKVKTTPPVPAKLTGYTSSGTGIISETSVKNEDNIPQNLTYEVTPTAFSCQGSSKEFVVTINPTPQVSFSIDKQTICNTNSNQKVSIASDPPGASIIWTATIPSTITGFGTTTGTNEVPIYQLTNISDHPDSIKIESKANTVGVVCPGSLKHHYITVIPTPISTPLPDITKCANENISIIKPTGTATSFVWENSSNAIGLSTLSGVNEIPAFLTTNNGILPIESVVSITPKFSFNSKECIGEKDEFKILVNPRPVLDNLVPLTNCNNIEFPEKLITSSINSATYKWENNTPSIGLASNGTLKIPSFKGVNTTDDLLTAIISVTPTYLNNLVGCDGQAMQVEYIVKPTARVTNADIKDTICSGVFSKKITWKTNVLESATSFEWKLINNPDSVSGHEISGLGDFKSVKILNKAKSIRSLVYRLKPTIYGCLGDTSFLYTLYINPSASLKDIDNQVICGGGSYVKPTFSSDVLNTIFKWSLRDSLLVPSTVSGYLKNGVAELPSKTVQNTGVLPYTLIYDVSTDVSGCSGQSIEFKLTVNPAPKVSFDLTNQTICSATTSKSVDLSSSSPGVFFEWKINSIPDSLIGVNKTLGTNQIDVFTLSNKSMKPIDLVISAKAYTKAATNSCYGKDTLYTITTNPVAKVKDVPTQEICHGSESLLIEFKGTGTSYNWNTKEVDFGLVPTSGVDKVSSFVMKYLDTTSFKNIELYIQPKYTFQQVTCDGILDTFYIKALPKPIITVESATICLGKKAVLKGEGAASNATYLWSPSNGLTCTNCLTTNASPESTTEYTVIGTNRFGCKDTTTTIVFVNPLPKVDAGPDTTLCNQPIPHTMLGKVEGLEKPGFWSGSPDLTIDGIYTPKTNGIYKVVYNFVLPSGCENFDTTLVTVKDVEKSNAGSDLVACFNDPDVLLNGTPKPGTWTGFNVSTDGIFKPVKDTTVNLVYSIGKGTCLNRDTMTFKVQPDFYINAGPDKEFCFSDKEFDFIEQNYEPKLPQINGEWKGNGITDKIKGTFKANIAGVGKHNIVFTYKHPVTSCVKYDTLIAEVHPLPEMKFKVDSIVCLNTTQTIQNLTNYLQSSDWTVFPKSKYSDKNPTHKFDSVGFFDVRLIATSPFGCIDSLTKNIEVREGPVARFTRTPDSTCGLVSFVNLSKGIGVTYDWNFGNGDRFDQRDPVDLIYKPGVIKDTTYTIRLKIENLCGIDSMSLPVVVKPVPKIIFAPNVNEGCSVLPITFANKTVGLPDELKWDLYGDGNFIEIRDSLIYRNYTTGNTSSTTYDIKVIAVNECGTDTAITKILVHPNTVKAHFNPDKQEGCTDLDVKFTQYSMGNNFHIWYFGDGTSSKDENPTHKYSKAGNYNVSLAVNNGCSYDTMRTMIKVYKTPKVDFVKSHDSLCLKNTFVFNSVTDPLDQLSYKWYFGDGDTSVMIDASHTYVKEGVYDVKLKVTNIDNYCGSEKTYKVYVKPRPIASFEMDTMRGCSPVFVSFKNTSSGANYHSWNFGDGVLSNGIDVQHTFKSIQKDTIFNVRLIVENASSCKDTFSSAVRVFPVPIINYSYTPSDQCYTPMYADFTNQSIGAQTYKWFFHDGLTSLEMNPRMEYQLAGKYYVKLEGKNEFGCIDSLVREVIKYPKPKAEFSADKTKACIPANFSFTNTSQGATLYYWDFGNGNSKNTKDAVFEYTKDGTYAVRLIVENSDKCRDTMTIPVIAFPIPKTDFSYQSTDSCYSPMNTIFTNKSSGAQFYEWDFKNGLVSSLTNPSTTYTNADQYLVSLKATNEFNCSVTKERVVTLLQKPKANFKVDVVQGCIPLLVTFTNESQFADYYNWNFADGNIASQKDTKNLFRVSGVDEKQEFNVNLVVEGVNGCKDTIEKTITTFPIPESTFNYTTTDPCFNPMIATFNNQSLYGKRYEWKMGDGSTSTLTNPLITYNKTGDYQVDLITTNKFSCNDTTSKIIRMLQKPDAQFTMDKLNGCIPLSVSFTNTSQFSFLNYWSFDDANTSVEVSPNHIFSKVGELNVQLISESADKCKDTVFHKITTYPLPVPDFTFTTTDPCYIPMNAMITNKSTGSIGYKWNFGNGNTSTLVNPIEQYNASGTYKVILEAINEYQCTAIKTDDVIVKNIPIANFDSDRLDGCMPLNVNFFNLSSGFKYSSWDFGDSNSSNDLNGNHTFTKDGIYTIRLISENIEGCPDTISKSITVHPLPLASFGYTNTDPCYSPMIVQMTNKSLGAVSYDWLFSNGETSDLTHPSTSFHVGGTHLLSLVAQNEFGCKDDTALSVISYNPPNIKSALFSGEECQYDQSNFSVEGDFINKYTWDMGDGVKNEGQRFNYTYTKDGIYTITIYAEGEGNCKDTLVVNKKMKIKKDPRADFDPINILVEGKKNGTVEFENQSSFSTKYYWDFGDGDTSSLESPIHKYYNNGNYQTTLISYNQFNCVDTIVINVKVDFFKGLHVPNAMYIGHQDYEVSHFLPKGVGLYQYEITIYDDWGNLIWRSSAIDEQGRPAEAWDGKYKDEYVQQDSYVWKVEAIFKDDSVWIGKEYEPTVYKRSGTVTVIK